MSIRELPYPADGERVETGPVQFGDDWPGVFIRGDNAAYYAMNLDSVIDYLESNELSIFEVMILRGLRNTLTGCIVGPAAEMFSRQPD